MFTLALMKKLNQPGICLLIDEQEQEQGQVQQSFELQLQYADESDDSQKRGRDMGDMTEMVADIYSDDRDNKAHDEWLMPQPAHAMTMMTASQLMKKQTSTVPSLSGSTGDSVCDCVSDGGSGRSGGDSGIIDSSNSISGSSSNSSSGGDSTVMMAMSSPFNRTSDMSDDSSSGRKDDELRHEGTGAGDDERYCASAALDLPPLPTTRLSSLSSSSPPLPPLTTSVPDSLDDPLNSGCTTEAASQSDACCNQCPVSCPQQSPPGSPLLHTRHKGAFGSPSPLPPAVSAVPAVWHGITGSNMKRHMHVNFLIDVSSQVKTPLNTTPLIPLSTSTPMSLLLTVGSSPCLLCAGLGHVAYSQCQHLATHRHRQSHPQ